MRYSYTAVTEEGKTVRGVIEASNDVDFFKYMDSQSLYCSDFHVKGAKSASNSNYKMKLKELSSFCKEFYVLSKSGIGIVEIFALLADKAQDKKKKACFLSITENIEKGLSTAEAMAKELPAFPTLMVNMVEAGELSGSVPTVIANLATYYEKEFRTRGKVTSMMIYPAVLFVMMVVIVLALFTFVLPNFFKSFGDVELPLITRIVMGISNFLINKWYILLIVCGVLFAAMNIFLATPMGTYWKDKLKCTMPVIGKLQMVTYTSRFCSTLSILIRTGITMLDAIYITASALDNKYLDSELNDVAEQISMGRSLSYSLTEKELFNDGLLWSMISSGEETGTLEEILEDMCEHYEAQADIATEKMTKLLEPLMIIIIGIVVGAVVMSVMIPMYSMYGSIG